MKYINLLPGGKALYEKLAASWFLQKDIENDNYIDENCIYLLLWINNIKANS